MTNNLCSHGVKKQFEKMGMGRPPNCTNKVTIHDTFCNRFWVHPNTTSKVDVGFLSQMQMCSMILAHQKPITVKFLTWYACNLGRPTLHMQSVQAVSHTIHQFSCRYSLSAIQARFAFVISLRRAGPSKGFRSSNAHSSSSETLFV